MYSHSDAVQPPWGQGQGSTPLPEQGSAQEQPQSAYAALYYQHTQARGYPSGVQGASTTVDGGTEWPAGQNGQESNPQWAAVEAVDASTMEVRLTGGVKLPMGRTYRDEVLAALPVLGKKGRP